MLDFLRFANIIVRRFFPLRLLLPLHTLFSFRHTLVCQILNLTHDVLILFPLYELVGSRWTDRGTAFCCGEFDSDIDEARLIVKAEGTGQEILSCRVRGQDVYQRQQDAMAHSLLLVLSLLAPLGEFAKATPFQPSGLFSTVHQ